MELTTTLPPTTPLRDVPSLVRRIESLGFDTIHIPETVHDSLSVALLALEHTQVTTVRTSMTLAFTRSPMVVAYAAWDLARFSSGRFQLGLATQVRGNIVGRFSMPWGQPAERLADFITALRAIYESFQTGAKLDYEGPFYTFNRLQPYFNPGPLEVNPPPIYIGGVNEKICHVGGALADGFVTHPTNSHPLYLKSTVLPALKVGSSEGSRSGAPRVIVVPKGIVASDTRSLRGLRNTYRKELAFLYSTPAYRPTLSLFGFDSLGEELSQLVRVQQWDRLEAVLDDSVLEQLIPQGTYQTYPDILSSWYQGICDGIAIDLPDDPDLDDRFARMVQDVRERFDPPLIERH